ncbi:MAG: hypothetical protein AUK03_12165 [Anaerolineae bacterium CG2_30_64_16]|nr:MAG: hypothetical protein AUK03_12165 [Anaerolineae bacterium CG2_30_64_16]
MITKRLLIAITLIASLISITVLTTAHANNLASSDQPEYAVEQRPNGHLRIRVQVNLADRVERDHYASRQRAEAMALARSGVGSVPVQITFVRPLSIAEMQLLAQRTGLVAELVIFEARDANQGQHTVAVGGNGGDLVDLDSLSPDLEVRSLRLVGVTAMRGTVPASASGLGQLASDERIYIPDVTPYQLAVEVAARYGLSVDKVQVSVPTPHWYLSAER